LPTSLDGEAIYTLIAADDVCFTSERNQKPAQ
jgi:hypothetical protein